MNFDVEIRDRKRYIESYQELIKLLEYWKEQLGDILEECKEACITLDEFDSESITLNVYPNNPENEEEMRSLRLFCMRHSGTMIRKFNEYTGYFRWEPKNKGKINFRVHHANILSKECTIEPYTDTIIKYRSKCPND